MHCRGETCVMAINDCITVVTKLYEKRSCTKVLLTLLRVKEAVRLL